MFSNEQLLKKWQPVLEHADLPEIKDRLRKSVTAQLLENTERSMQESGGSVRALLEAGTHTPTNATGSAEFACELYLLRIAKNKPGGPVLL